jgi:hypothetical protein
MRSLALALLLVSSLPAQTVTLQSVIVSGTSVTVTYSKDFVTCAHLQLLNGQLVHSANWFCASGTNVAVTVPISGFNSLLQLGVQVKLCHGNNSGICSAPVTVIVNPVFTPSQPTISLAAGGIQLLAIDGSTLGAGATYLIGGSITGTSPPIPVGMFLVPLVMDAWFDFTIMNPNAPPISGFQGTLDAFGAANASITLPAGLPPSLAGLTAYHVVGLVMPGGVIVGVSAAVTLTLVP